LEIQLAVEARTLDCPVLQIIPQNLNNFRTTDQVYKRGLNTFKTSLTKIYKKELDVYFWVDQHCQIRALDEITARVLRIQPAHPTRWASCIRTRDQTDFGCTLMAASLQSRNQGNKKVARLRRSTAA